MSELNFHPEARAHLELSSEREPATPAEVGLERARSLYDQRAQRDSLEAPTVSSAEDIELTYGGHTVEARRFRPIGEARATVVYAHGGGFVFGSRASYGPFCRELCSRALVEVFLVDYRRAPEHEYPAAHQDMRTAVAAVHEEVSEERMVLVGGDSAGGLLALAAAHDLADEFDVAGQILLYPLLDPRVQNESYERIGEEVGLSRETMKWFWDQYLGDRAENTDLAEISPLFREDLGKLPPTLLIIAELDPLIDEINELEQKLRDAGVRVDKMKFPGVLHGFVRLSAIYRAMSHAALDRIARFVMERS